MATIDPAPTQGACGAGFVSRHSSAVFSGRDRLE